ncbi:MAG: hypothetical protein R2942_13970 [Ignavibacteria bacterium]
MTCGASGTVSITTNSGRHGREIQAAGTNAYLNQIQMTGTNSAYCVGRRINFKNN